MKKFVLAASGAAFFALSSVTAFADQANGTITGINVDTGAVTLNDGKTYIIPRSVNPPVASLKVGNVVTITYMADRSNGLLQASAVVVHVRTPRLSSGPPIARPTLV